MPDRSPTTNPSVPADRVQEGDVLFFAAPVDTGDLTDFAQLAARAQGAPWVHVAVAGRPGDDGRPEVIGFDQTGDPDRVGINWTPTVVVAGWSSTDGHAVTALRSPEGGPDLAVAARSLVGAPYDYPGLLAFAAATQARMFAPGAARDRLLHFADGVVAQDRADRAAGAPDAPEPYTCVSAVAAALRTAGRLVAVEEPAGDMTGDPELRDLLATTIDELYERVDRASPVARTAAPIGRPALIATDELHRAWGYDGDVVTQFPGPVVPSTTAYLELLDRVIAHLATGRVTADQLVSKGELEPRRDAVHPTVSPAMLHAGLLAAGFTEVV